MQRTFSPAMRVLTAITVMLASLVARGDVVFTWMDGSNLVNQPGIYSGLPADIQPGGRIEAAYAKDPAGNLWMFGGNGYDSAGNNGYLNDLWKYEPSTGLWTFVFGSNLRNAPSVHGTINVPTPAVNPGARSQAAMWATADGKLWLFGGVGLDDAASIGTLNDLMMFDPATGLWTWISGSNLKEALSTPAGSNATPGNRSWPIKAQDQAGNFWIYGGFGVYPGATLLSDLWKFDPVARQWTLITGSSTATAPVYGVQGVAAPTNRPGSRDRAEGWFTPDGDFMFFGGGVAGPPKNDVWRYDIASGLWTWVKGGNVGGEPGVYGTLGVPAATNTPGARNYISIWSDGSDTVWLFGGYGKDEANNLGELSDLWKYNITTNTWTWMKGDKLRNQPGSFGVLGVPAATNLPRARDSFATWVDNNGNFWMFSGYLLGGQKANDLWRLVIDYTADLAVSLTAADVVIGELTTYTITVTNNGPDPATSVTVTQTIAPNLLVVGADPAQGSIISVPGTITWNVGIVNSGASTSATVTVRGVDLGPAASSVEVTTADIDPASANNVATANINVLAGNADVAITTSAPASITLHGTITYEITATNNGPNASRNLVITQLLPTPSRIESLTVTSGTIVGTTSPLSVIWDLDIFPAGATANATVVITPLAPGNATSTIQATADTPDPVPANNTATVNVNVIQGPGPDLAGSMTATPKCKTKKGVLQCKVKINLTVTNPPPATDIAAKSVARFYLSDDNILDAGDLVLGDRNIKKVKVGKTKTSKLNAKVLGGISPTGKFVIGLLDAGAVVTEGNEFNNVIVFGPLP